MCDERPARSGSSSEAGGGLRLGCADGSGIAALLVGRTEFLLLSRQQEAEADVVVIATDMVTVGFVDSLRQLADRTRARSVVIVADRWSADLCAHVLTRPFPAALPGTDPWQTLLWATGRAGLPGHPRPTNWRWDGSPRR